MSGFIEISHRLEEWAAVAGYTLTPGVRTDDGRALFWSTGGEVRHFIGVNDGGWFVVTDSDRLGPEYLDLAAPSMATIERYFFGKFGRFIRSKKGLPRVHMPIAREEISDGFTIGALMLEGVQRLALIASDGSAVAVSSGDELSGTADLVKLSLYVSATVDDIVTSSLTPDGKPLFNPR
jgi:immunity protein 61 of polymorphic toxin system